MKQSVKPTKKRKTKKKPNSPLKGLKRNIRLESLDPKMNPRVRREFNDADYLRKLPPDVLRYYAQFTDEYLNGSIRKDKMGRVVKGHLHNTNELAKKCSDANNYRNNDLFSVGKANNFVHEIDPLIDARDGWYITNKELTEEALISQLDSGEQNEELSFKEYIKVREHMLPSRREQLDAEFYHIPYSHLYYYVYVRSELNDYQLDKVLADPLLLHQLIKNPKFFKRKKYRTNSRKNGKN